MSQSKVKMPREIEVQCQKVIHMSAGATATAGAIPIPMSDAIPITVVQIGMIVKLGKVFGVSLSESAAKSIASVSLVQEAGRLVARNLIKVIPGIGPAISAATAAALTETLGWIIADDFYRMSIGEQPVDIMESAGNLKQLFSGYRTHR